MTGAGHHGQHPHIDDRISVAPQIAPDDVAEIAAAGFNAIVNNRPDGEDAGQPEGAEMRAAAEAAGLAMPRSR